MDLHWRNSMKSARFLFNTDARGALFLLFFLMHMRLWTLGLVVVIIGILYVLEQRGMSFDASLRALRYWIVGAHRPRILSHHKARYVDFG
ncbi:MAG: IcmT/TraK family protein [Bdellovibrionales bacterium]